MKKVYALLVFLFAASACTSNMAYVTPERVLKMDDPAAVSYLFIAYSYDPNFDINERFDFVVPFEAVQSLNNGMTRSDGYDRMTMDYNISPQYSVYALQPDVTVNMRRLDYLSASGDLVASREIETLQITPEVGKVYYMNIYITESETIGSMTFYIPDNLFDAVSYTAAYDKVQYAVPVCVDYSDEDYVWFDSSYPMLSGFEKVNLCETIEFRSKDGNPFETIMNAVMENSHNSSGPSSSSGGYSGEGDGGKPNK